MTALKEQAVQIIEDIEDKDMTQVVAILKTFTFSEEQKQNKDAAMAGLQILQSFAGTLPPDFDYKKELEEAREKNRML
jgi:hypothetical protein